MYELSFWTKKHYKITLIKHSCYLLHSTGHSQGHHWRKKESRWHQNCLNTVLGESKGTLYAELFMSHHASHWYVMSCHFSLCNQQHTWCYRLRQLLYKNSYDPHLSKLIITTYVLPIASQKLPIWGYMTKACKQKIQYLIGKGLWWACKPHYLTSNLIIQNAFGVLSLNATLKAMFCKFYRRCICL